MRILQLISSIGFFGAENVLLELSKEFRKTGFISIVGVIKNLYNPHLEIAHEAKRNDLPVEIFPCNGRLDLKTIFLIRRFLKENKINIIHSHGYKSNLYALMASLDQKVCLITTCHNWLGDDYKMRFYAILDRFFLRKFNRIVAVSEEVMRKIINSGISIDKVKIIQNGILVDRFRDSHSVKQIKKDVNVKNGVTVIGTVGRISEEKGHRNLLNTALRILEQFPRTIFLIIGDGPLRREIQRDYDSPSIVFTGIRKDIPDLYQCMDIFVLPSLTEGFPMVLLEALASKLPVIATCVGGVPNIIIDKETGLLVEPGDEEGLKKALLYLMENTEEAKAMGLKGYQRVKEYFSSETMAMEYMDIYQELAQRCADYSS